MFTVGCDLGRDPYRDAEHWEQPVDRDHENVALDALDPPQSHQAQDGERAVARPASPGAGTAMSPAPAPE